MLKAVPRDSGQRTPEKWGECSMPVCSVSKLFPGWLDSCAGPALRKGALLEKGQAVGGEFGFTDRTIRNV